MGTTDEDMVLMKMEIGKRKWEEMLKIDKSPEAEFLLNGYLLGKCVDDTELSLTE